MDGSRFYSKPIGSNHHPGGMFRPFSKSNWLASIHNHIEMLGRDWKGKKILFLSIANIIGIIFLYVWARSSRSMGLIAFSYLLAFDSLCLITSFLSAWIEKQNPTFSFTFGFERVEVLCLFSGTILLQLGAMFIIKECIERLFLEHQEVDMTNVLPGLMIGLGSHLLVVYGIHSKVLRYIIESSSSNWLQEHVAEISQSICHLIPGLSSVLLPRLNPLVLLGWASATLIFIAYFLIILYDYVILDTLAALGLALVIFVTFNPMCIDSGRILLQTVPGHIVGQLDKCLREASTLDGVLEFRFEHFWTLAYDDMVGTLHVRVRRDANDQLVLAHLVDRLSNLVKHLTIQVFKEDWSRPSFQLLHETRLNFSPSPSLQPNGAVPHFSLGPTKTF